MAVNNVGRVDRVHTTTAAGEAQRAELRRRLELHQASGFERGSGADLGGFVSPLDPGTQAGITAFYARYTPEQQARLQTTANALGATLVGAGATGTASAALQEATATTLAVYVSTTAADELSTVGQDFMWMAIGGMESYIKGFAQRLEDNLALGKDVRASITELRDMLRDWPDGETRTFTRKEVQYDKDGKATVIEHNEELTKDKAEALMKDLEDQLANINEVSDLAKFDLQSKYQDYQQGVQTLAAIQRGVHDDAMKIINNLKA